ncbi:MAG TPA: hypothetical protein VMQ44_01810 [Candidatus Saccharimonadales bacterium]|nr:hypothetical protein [Candidatus Saccharimonadales bacterium]
MTYGVLDYEERASGNAARPGLESVKTPSGWDSGCAVIVLLYDQRTESFSDSIFAFFDPIES